MTINERIKYLRKLKKISQKEFAKKLGITQSGVSYIEQPNTIIAEKTIKTICSIFSINEKWLYDGIEPIFCEVTSFDFELDKFAKDKGASPLELEILKAYFDMDKSLRKEVIDHFISYFKNDNIYDKAREFAEKQLKSNNSANINNESY